MRIRPAAQRQGLIALPEHLPQLPRMIDAARRPEDLVAAQDDQRRKPALARPLGVGKAVLERVLRGHERNDPLARHVTPQIDHEVPEVVLFLRSDRAVGQEDEGSLPGETTHGVIGVDPGVHPLARRQLRAWRPQLRRKDRDVSAKSGQEIGDSHAIRNLQLGIYNDGVTPCLSDIPHCQL